MGAELPLALALVAGAVAAVNPCGFALLPAYLAMLVTDAPAGSMSGTRRQVLRAGRTRPTPVPASAPRTSSG
jgi:cytochrome c biogenesis protein CcdA